jgi:hypothetical protein
MKLSEKLGKTNEGFAKELAAFKRQTADCNEGELRKAFSFPDPG